MNASEIFDVSSPEARAKTVRRFAGALVVADVIKNGVPPPEAQEASVARFLRVGEAAVAFVEAL